MADVVDIISAIEQYLAKSGKGNSYLADKITEIFEDSDSPFNIQGTIISELRKSMMDLNKSLNKTQTKMNDLSSNVQGLIRKIKSVKLPSEKDMKFPNMSAFNRLAQKVDKFKLPDLTPFKDISAKLKDFGDKLEKSKIDLLSLSASKEKAVEDRKTINVNVESFSSSAVKYLITQMNDKVKFPSIQPNRINVTKNEVSKESGSGGIIGTILKTVFGGIAVVAGIGMISKFLETPQGQKAKEFVIEKFNSLVEFVTPYINTAAEWIKKQLITAYEFIKPYVITGVEKAVDGVEWFMQQTFNFFGLKEILGKKFEGISVLLTKGIFYGVTSLGTKILDFFSFGLFGKTTNLLYKPFEFLGKIMTGFGGMIDNFIVKLTSSSGVIGKSVGAVTKIFSGGLLKLFGKGLIKRIPIIGSFISFKDAYDRFQGGDYIGGFLSLGSGLVNFIPGIGTVLSIGIDMLNSFIDYKTDGSAQTKSAILMDYIIGLRDKIWNGLKNMIGDLFENLNPANWAIFKKDPNDQRSWWQKIKDGTSSMFSDGPTPASTQNPPTPPPLQNPSAPSSPAFNPEYIRDKMSDSIMESSKSTSETLESNYKQMRELNKKFDVLLGTFMEGFNLMTSATVQGSQNVTQAVLATGGSSKSSGNSIVTTSDPINQFRVRAQRAIEYESR